LGKFFWAPFFGLHGITRLSPLRDVFIASGSAVCDGAAMPANPGANPSLTITALAEHAMSHVLPAAASRA
jgi:choline dehydrogenase-like flavoprotein